jgi:cytochrome c
MTRPRTTAPLLAAALALLPGAAICQDDAQLAFNSRCRTCHTTDEGDNRLGPSLYKVIGREAGSLPDYGYSSAMVDAGLTWDEETLDRFIEDPNAVVPGNNMKPYPGVSSPEVRAKIITYLKQQGGGA